MDGRPRSIGVIGDVSMDWAFVNPLAGGTMDLADFTWAFSERTSVHLTGQAGGAPRLVRLLQAILAVGGIAGKVLTPPLPDDAGISPSDPRLTSTFSVIARLLPPGGRGRAPFRIDHYLGMSAAGAPAPAAPLPGDGAPDVLVIVDNGLGFAADERLWRPALDAGPAAIIALLAQEYETPLVRALLAEHVDALTVVTGVGQLRQAGAAIAKSLSWEQIAEQTQAAVAASPLGRARSVVVSIGLEGALVFERGGGARLVFDPRAQEGDWLDDHPGIMPGYHLAVAASVACDGDGAATTGAVARGLAGARAIHEKGFDVAGGDEPEILFPFAAAAAAIVADDHPFAIATYPAGGQTSLLSQLLESPDIAGIAVAATLQGVGALPGEIPVESVGAWSSVDRTEIETLRGVGQILGEYVRHYTRGGRLDRPLSLAVFGPPGAGKSFAVKQLARRLLAGSSQTLEFNLSQFDDPAELIPAFHQIRDAVLEQHLPLVFWDEFDTALQGQSLGWLRHFLAPMQDGAFREGGTFHPLGPAVFVFAGGTAPTLEAFARAGDEELARAAKRPDFVSRLRGYMNILGPNPSDLDDRAVPLRRALLLRSLLLRKAPQLAAPGPDGGVLRADPAVVRAFLLIGAYEHGARSMEAIVDMSALVGALRFERSALPARRQLALHVDPDEFLGLVGEE